MSSLERREFLRVGGGLAIGGFMANPLAEALSSQQRAGKGGARSCILIYLLGGPPHLDMWDLKPDAPAEIRGPFRPIATNQPGMRICEHFPRLSRLADRYALVRSVSHNNHNHTPMIFYTLTGRPVERPGEDNDVRPPQRTDFPHMGGVLAHFKQSPSGLPGYVAIPELAVRSSTRRVQASAPLLRGGGGGMLGPLADPLAVNGDPGTPEAIPALNSPVDVTAEPPRTSCRAPIRAGAAAGRGCRTRRHMANCGGRPSPSREQAAAWRGLLARTRADAPSGPLWPAPLRTGVDPVAPPGRGRCADDRHPLQRDDGL